MTNYRYQIGGSLKNDDPNYVVRQADDELYQVLKAGEFCYVLNSRQMGKSSLLVRMNYRLKKEGFRCVAIDMTSIGSENITPAQWYKGIVFELGLALGLFGKFNLKTWWHEQDDISVLQKLSLFITDVLLVQFPQERIFIFVDEIDSILSLEFPIDDFFALIRFCYNQRAINPEYNRITFALFGVATPSDLIKDKNRTPFNIGKSIELQGFYLEETQPLTKGLQAKFENHQVIISEILGWTCGQPFLTQKLCKLVMNEQRGAGGAGGAGEVGEEITNSPIPNAPCPMPTPHSPLPNPHSLIARLVRKHIIENWESQDEPEHLRTIRDRLLRNEKRAARMLGIYQQILQGVKVPTDDSREQSELLLSGLMVKQQGLLKVKNRIYQEVFHQEWVEKQLASLRPYSQALDAWVASNQQDESRLLRGQALIDAENWSQGKSLSDLDYKFLSASQEIDRREVQRVLEAERTNVETHHGASLQINKSHLYPLLLFCGNISQFFL